MRRKFLKNARGGQSSTLHAGVAYLDEVGRASDKKRPGSCVFQ